MIQIPPDWKLLIPCYNGGAPAREFLWQLKEQVPSESVLLVNDGSREEFRFFLDSLGFECLHLANNCGKGAALLQGLQSLQDQGVLNVITLDCDGQHPLNSLPDFFSQGAKEGWSVLLGARPFRFGQMPLARIFSNRVSSRLVSFVAGARVWDAQCGYRAYHLPFFVKNGYPQASRFQWESEVLIRSLKKGGQVAHVSIPAIYGEEISNISHFKDTARFLKMLYRTWRENEG